MATPKRRTLADRNKDAINREEAAEPAVEIEVSPVKEASAVPAAAKKPTTESKKAGRPARSVDVTRQGIYLTQEQFNNAKAAYLADWTNGGEANTFTLWIGEAITRHADRTFTARLKHETKKPARAEARTGSSRSFNVPSAAIARMRAAITQEHDNGRWLSDSAWCGEAIDAAISEAQKRNGGSLPVPPARLPNRLVR